MKISAERFLEHDRTLTEHGKRFDRADKRHEDTVRVVNWLTRELWMARLLLSCHEADLYFLARRGACLTSR